MCKPTLPPSVRIKAGEHAVGVGKTFCRDGLDNVPVLNDHAVVHAEQVVEGVGRAVPFAFADGQDKVALYQKKSKDSASYNAGTTSVFAKSSPTNSNRAPLVFAAA